MTTPLTLEQRRDRIIGNLKANKPSIMTAKFAAHHRSEEAERRGEEYVPPPTFTFLILEDSGEGTPITLDTVQKLVEEWTTKSASAEAASTSLQLQDAKIVQRYGLDEEAGEGEKVEGVRLSGGARLWWDKLSGLLQPENWTETMVFYVEYLTREVECEGARMEALRIRRHFAAGEVEKEGDGEGKGLDVI